MQQPASKPSIKLEEEENNGAIVYPNFLSYLVALRLIDL